MAGSKEIRDKIKSIQSTRKITKTMEMVATSKMKRAIDRVTQSQPYMQKLQEVLGRLSGVEIEHPLLRQPAEVKRSLIILVTANRGLCGGYNSNLIRMAKKLYQSKVAEGLNPELYAFGRKGIQHFKFFGLEMFKVNPDLTDKPTFEEGAEIANELMEYFTSGHFDEITIVYSHYISAGKQPATTMQLLPLSKADEDEDTQPDTDYLFEPDPQSILKSLLPLSIRTTMYRVLIEAVACEQFARRVAMKNATDAAEDMEKELVLNYNKARQSQITQEISEIVGGVEALK